MNLRETVRSGYKVFNRMSEEKRKAHILAVQYIELLATQTNTKMEPWDLLEVFGTGKGNELLTNKTEINRKFFAKVEDIKSKTPAEAFALESRITEQMDAITRGMSERNISKYRRARDTLVRDAQSYFEQANRKLIQASEQEQLALSVEKRESTVPAQISQIVQENFWEFHQLSGTCLELLTKADIILTHKNQAAGVDLRVNMGRFKSVLDLGTMDLRVLQHERNILVSNYYHPHVNAIGQICWGTAAATAADKLPKGEVADVLRLLASVLSNYNDGNPYMHLALYQEKATQDAPPRDRPITPPPVFAPRVDTGLGSIQLTGRSILEPFTYTLRGIDLSSSTVPGVTVVGHPTDSTEIPLDGCGCEICIAGRESRARQEEFERLTSRLGDMHITGVPGPSGTWSIVHEITNELSRAAEQERGEEER